MLDLVMFHAKRLLGDRRGISALEYGVLAAVVVVAVALFAGGFNGIFSGVISKVQSAAGI